jgi:hypothetical protein
MMIKMRVPAYDIYFPDEFEHLGVGDIAKVALT